MRVFAIQSNSVNYIPYVQVDDHLLRVAAFVRVENVESKKEIDSDVLLSEFQNATDANLSLPATLKDTYIQGDFFRKGLKGNWECVALSILNSTQFGEKGTAGFGENDDRATWTTFWHRWHNELSPIVNTTVQDYQIKGRNARRRALNWYHQEAVSLFAPFKEQSILSEANTLALYYSPELGYVVRGAGATELTKDEAKQEPKLQVNELFPTIELDLPTTVTAGEAVCGDCRLLFRGELWTSGAEIVVEASGGYLPLRRLPLKDGARQFKVLTDGLEPGDEIKIKAGWRYFSGEAEAIVKVV